MKYPTINYIGNKEKIVDWIASLIPHDANSFFDAFSGGCSVSYKAKTLGLQVFSNDILNINFQIAKAFIENNETLLSKDDVDQLFSGEPIEGFMFNNYSNRFYYPDECKELDIIRKNIDSFLNPYKKSLAFALLRRAMIRKMPYSRFTINWDKIVELRNEDLSYSKYGRRRSYHNKTFRFHFEDNLNEYNNAIFDNQKNNKALNLDIFDAINITNADVIYLDPPYSGTMNDYYGFYGLLDSYIKGEQVKPFDKNFMDKKNIKYLFYELFSRLSKYRYWMLSYNSRSTPSKDEMLELLNHFSNDIAVHEMPYAYRVTGKEKKKNDIEYLFLIDTHL
ncbi:MAG: DNA adenine methylase [Muribaculaceae bacterium]|nr:DNA adenine methylase [Muribaculaceae bacterium]